MILLDLNLLRLHRHYQDQRLLLVLVLAESTASILGCCYLLLSSSSVADCATNIRTLLSDDADC